MHPDISKDENCAILDYYAARIGNSLLSSHLICGGSLKWCISIDVCWLKTGMLCLALQVLSHDQFLWLKDTYIVNAEGYLRLVLVPLIGKVMKNLVQLLESWTSVLYLVTHVLQLEHLFMTATLYWNMKLKLGTWNCLHSFIVWWSDCEAHEIECFLYFVTSHNIW
jgi:hypothetical protein